MLGNEVLAAVPKPADSTTQHELMTIASEAAATWITPCKRAL